MSSAAFIEALPVIEFVGQLLGKDVLSRPLSDSDRVKVLSLIGNVGCICSILLHLIIDSPFKMVPRSKRPLEV